ncbi:hypothetical protein KCP76_25570 [Salmonella enterica subsp. enterica serovar Weltevreden]|nr:hypothetical protein KCP76_25570 [Salmonella enterica subsp. enterica serovar Weltevreden]
MHTVTSAVLLLGSGIDPNAKNRLMKNPFRKSAIKPAVPCRRQKPMRHTPAYDIDGNLFAFNTRNLFAISATGVRTACIKSIFTKYFTSKVHSTPAP